jgi:hypothetical protein
LLPIETLSPRNRKLNGTCYYYSSEPRSKIHSRAYLYISLYKSLLVHFHRPFTGNRDVTFNIMPIRLISGFRVLVFLETISIEFRAEVLYADIYLTYNIPESICSVSRTQASLIKYNIIILIAAILLFYNNTLLIRIYYIIDSIKNKEV